MSNSDDFKKATREMTRDHNQRLVLKHIYNKGPISRAQLARLTGLTRSTVSTVVLRLLKKKLVHETGTSRVSVGKPATLLEFNAESSLIISLDLASTAFKGYLYNLRGEMKECVELGTEHQRGQAAIQGVLSLVNSLKQNWKILGVGIGTPGVVEPHNGTVIRSTDLGWENVALKRLVEERFHIPTHIANDSQAAALAQYVFGCRKQIDNLILLKMGRGVGAGMIINGKMFFGDAFGAGEIGHVVVDENGEQCECGQWGCLETVVGVKSLKRQLEKMCKTEMKDFNLKAFCQSGHVIDLVQLLDKGQPCLNRAIEKGAHALGSVLALLIGTLNIGYVFLAGEMIQLGDYFLDPLKQRTIDCSMPILMDKINIQVSKLIPNLVDLGAVALVLQQELGLV
ncbi:MAG: hypothetical protein CR997_13155 [Acidobacteria bacterium]|nr:MAG: hypothetical protein CR997_13155 [Acidobacteriota bacterium]